MTYTLFFQPSLALLGAFAGSLMLAAGYFLRRSLRRAPGDDPSDTVSLGRLHAAIESISRDLAVTNERIDLMAATNSPKVSENVDLTVRSKVLRLHRLGQSVDQIAASLKRPKGEVSLTISVHAIAVRNALADSRDSAKSPYETRNPLPGFDMGK